MAFLSVSPAVAETARKWPFFAGLGLIIWVVYSGYVWIYNVFFHRLRKFPGPIFSAASEIPNSWHMLNGNMHLHTAALHAKYGEIVRIAPNQLSFINEQAWKDVHTHRQDGDGNTNRQLVRDPNQIAENGVYHLASAPDDVHARQRKMLSHAFSDRALREQEPLLRSYVDLVVRNLRNSATRNQPVNMVKTLNGLTFDIIGELAFGESFQACETDQVHPWCDLFFKVIKQGTRLQFAMALPVLSLFTLPLIPIVMKNAKAMFAFTTEKVRQRIAQGSNKERPDFMSMVLKYNTNDGTGITNPEMEATFQFLVGAGSDTTATTMSGLMWLTHANPSTLQTLQKEIRSSFSSDSDINILKVDQLPYLQAVIQETLRMYHPVPIAMTRRTPPSGVSICGEWIPGDVIVGVPHRTISLSPTNFMDPTRFVPERHLPKGVRPEIFDGDKKGALQPFLVGPRACLGKNLAMAEMKLTIANLIYNFDFELEPGLENWYHQKTYGSLDKPPLMMRVKDRKEKN